MFQNLFLIIFDLFLAAKQYLKLLIVFCNGEIISVMIGASML